MLRPYQRTLIAGVHAAVRDGARAPLMQAPTGAGKSATVIEGVIAPTVALGRTVVFAAHLEELLDDAAQRVRARDLPCGLVKAGRPSDPSAPVQVASTPTLARMLDRGEALPPCDRLILDEAHRSSSRTLRAIIGHYKARGALILGLSATPARLDDQPLDEFDALIPGPSVRSLIDGGYLVEPIVIAPKTVLTRGVAQHPVDVVNNHLADRRAVVFAPDAATALDIAARIPGAETILDSTPYTTRSTVRDRLASGETRHVVTVRALLEGFDAPVLDAVVLCSAFGSVSAYLQAIGRGLRPYTDATTGQRKRDCLVYDLRGAVHFHGLPDDPRRWSLDGAQGTSLIERAAPLRRCSACHALYRPRTVCPRCGCAHSTDARPLKVQRAAMFAASTVPLADRARQYLDGVVRAITAKNPSVSPAWARATAEKRAPSWVREALANPSPAPSSVPSAPLTASTKDSHAAA